MKTTKKVLSILLTVLMIVSIIPMAAFAENRTVEQFVSNDNLSVIAERLLKDIAGRMDKDIGTILRLVFQFMDDDSLTAAINGQDVMALSDEQLADILVAWLNANLPEWTSDLPDIVNTLLKLIDKNASLKDVDGCISLLAGACDSSILTSLGDAKNLNSRKLKDGKKTITKKNGYTNKQVVCALFNWLADDGQIAIIKKVVKGELKLGKVALVYDLDKEFVNDLNDTMKELPYKLKELIYDMFCQFEYTKADDGKYKLVDGEGVEIKDGEVVAERYNRKKIDLADSAYKDFNADELLAAALLHLLVPGGVVSKEEAQAATSLTFYQLVGKYAKDAITKYAVEPINGQFKRWLKNDVAVDHNYSFLMDAINWDYEVTAETFNLDKVATEGIFAQINTILCGFISEVFKAEAVKAMGIVDGDNSKLQANLDSVVKWFIANTPDDYEKIEGWAGVKKTAASNTLEQNAVAVIKCFFKQWFGEGYVAPAEATSLEALGAYAAYAAIDKFVVKEAKYSDWAYGNYSDKIFGTDGKMLAKDDAQWLDTLLTIGLDVGVYALNHNSKHTNFVLSAEDAKKLKESGWGYEYYLDEIADWGVNYINHIPAITDEIVATRGEYDGFGPFYKVNVVLNSLLPLALFTGCSDGYFDFDSKTFFIDKLLGGILDFDLVRIIDVLNVNDKASNPFNKPVISAVLDFAENLIFSIFEYDSAVGSETFTYEATENAVGYEYNKGTNSKFYRVTKTLDKKAGTVDYTLGDVNNDTKINTKDARLILQSAAKLVELTETQKLAADVNNDTKVNTKDARKILRVVAKLETL